MLRTLLTRVPTQRHSRRIQRLGPGGLGVLLMSYRRPRSTPLHDRHGA